MFRSHLTKTNKSVPEKRNQNSWETTPNCVCCGENMTEYLRSSSLHGLKYVGNNNLTLFER